MLWHQTGTEDLTSEHIKKISFLSIEWSRDISMSYAYRKSMMVQSIRTAKRAALILALQFSAQATAINISGPTCSEYFQTNYPANEFVLGGSGLATDKRTGLTWFRCAAGEFWHEGQCLGIANLMRWTDALAYAESSKIAGFSDWRLPTVDELQGIVEEECINPAINPFVFPSATADIYWSSQENFFNKFLAWGVYLFNGNDFAGHAKSTEHKVMLVRSDNSQ